MSRSPTIMTSVEGELHGHVWYVRIRARTKVSYRKYFIVSIIQGRKYFVIFNFVVLSDFENIKF